MHHSFLEQALISESPITLTSPPTTNGLISRQITHSSQSSRHQSCSQKRITTGQPQQCMMPPTVLLLKALMKLRFVDEPTQQQTAITSPPERLGTPSPSPSTPPHTQTLHSTALRPAAQARSQAAAAGSTRQYNKEPLTCVALAALQQAEGVWINILREDEPSVGTLQCLQVKH
jgi:hypothetical protein